MIWAKFQVDNKKVSFFYRPPNIDTGPLLHLRESLLKIVNTRDAPIKYAQKFTYYSFQNFSKSFPIIL